VSLKPYWKGFFYLRGVQVMLGCNSTGKFRGQLAAAHGIGNHNWLYPVAYCVMDAESTETWTWFMESWRLKQNIGHRAGLVIHTDACKGTGDYSEWRLWGSGAHMERTRHTCLPIFWRNFRGPLYCMTIYVLLQTPTPQKGCWLHEENLCKT
jgi:hypothetical protein